MFVCVRVRITLGVLRVEVTMALSALRGADTIDAQIDGDIDFFFVCLC